MLVIPMFGAGLVGSVFSDTMTNVQGGWQTYSFRTLIPSGQISAGGTQIRVSLQSLAGSFGSVIDDVWVGHWAGSGNAWDFDGNQVQVLFGATAGVTLSAAGAIQQSDPVNFALDANTDLIVAIGVNNTASQDKSWSTTAGIKTYEKSGGNGEENLTAPTGYTVQTRNDFVNDITVTEG